jgi:hypothetical protein
VIEPREALEVLFLFISLPFYDSGWFFFSSVDESLLNVLTLIFDWYPFLYLTLPVFNSPPAHMAARTFLFHPQPFA